ncbi:hypothetical protein K443DRAFT_32511, partial [Laccaria amethystina LaAM-08-1]
QCALNPDGSLKEASEITWHRDPDDETPIASEITNIEGGGKQNPIYLFYEQVDVNKDGKAGEPGDKHYKCYHGNHKVLTISKAMNCSLNGTSHFPPLHQLFLYMKLRIEHPPTSEEIQFASGRKPFGSSIHAEYLQKLNAQTSGIKEAFAKQKANAAEPWDQAKFEELLIEWIVACDQPFDEVEKPEFVSMMEYKRDPTKFSLPKKDGIPILSLDAWTSSNGYAFLA